MQNTNLTNCDREPIHTPGLIQPFGALMVTDPSLTILQVSENIQEFSKLSSSEVLGKKLNDVFGIDQAIAYSGELDFEIGDLSFALNKKPGQWLFEIEKKAPSNANLISRKIRKAAERFQSSLNWQELMKLVSEEVHQMSGFERVMIYKFHEDFHGEVIAESVTPGVESFMGLHYPASDIPIPARKVFLENWIRVIPNVYYTPIEITPVLNPQDKQPLNLGHTLLRSVSPIHIEYLKNMNVAATMTISIKSGDKLWGLIACHHSSPRLLDSNWRGAMEDIGRIVSGHLRDVSIVEEHFHRQRLNDIHSQIINRIQNTKDLALDLTTHTPNLLDLVRAKGAAAALYLDGKWETTGKVPSEDNLNKLVEWLVQNHSKTPVFYTHILPEIYPPAKNFKDVGSGLAAISVPKTEKNYILLFRPEIVGTVRWAGRPDKMVDPLDGKIHPRQSFEEWVSSVDGKSEEWKTWEIDAAAELRASIMALDLRKQFEKEQAARAEAVRAMQSREELMSVLSHDLKNPISSILLSVQLLERYGAFDPQDKNFITIQRISRAANNMNNLINDILHVTQLEAGHLNIEKKNCKLHDLLDEILDLLSPLATQSKLILRLSKSSVPCEAHCDRERVIQVLSNLIGNAIKFTPPGGVIEIGIEKCGAEAARVFVSDQGPGIPAENRRNIFDRFWQAKASHRLGTGLGLAITKGIVESHGGEIWVTDNEGGGSIFHFTLPFH